MKKTTLRICILGLLAIMLLSMCACSGGSALVGTWTGDGLELTFKSDGTFVANQYPRSGTYSVSGDTILMSADGETMIANFKVNGNKLTLTLDGDSLSLTKK